ncbi:CheW-like domain protein [Planctomycetes bacterium Pan216]|uniref:Chemotaxis protein CheW n=1 Tax=Kolteria novifilia TaxID=2527975 RepID=A0A518B4A7_9BACT|nr:CheW-like domain protein [Planctomycetes bacterium Pan216]
MTLVVLEETDEAVDCWNTIGVAGDGSCPELLKVTHCRNCPVFATAGRHLLDREPPSGYRETWTELLSKKESPRTEDDLSVVIFRVADQWLALETHLFREVSELRPTHRLPHRTNKVFKGLVNVNGELELYVSLHGLLEQSDENSDQSVTEEEGRRVYRRLVVIERDGDRWAFPVDEVHGVRRFPKSQRKAVPVTVAKTGDTFTRTVVPWDDRDVGVLDEQRLFTALQRSVR